MIQINIESFYRNLDPIMLVNNANKTLQCIELFQLLKVCLTVSVNQQDWYTKRQRLISNFKGWKYGRACKYD